jgi:hypothetical protein
MLLLGGSKAPCVNSGGQAEVSEYIINGDTFTMDIQEILDEFGCTSGQPMQNYKGTYYAKFSLTSFPILSNGEPDNSRKEYYKTFSLTFSF